MDVGTLWNDLDRLRPLLEVERWQLSDDQELEAHELLRRVVRELGHAGSRLIADLDFRGVPLAHGFQNSERWLAVTQRIELATARAELDVARAVETGQAPTVSEAWRGGHLDLERAVVVVRTVEQLREADVSADDIATAEELLASHAATLAPRDLTRAAKEVVARLAPVVDERHDDPATRTFTVARTGIGGQAFAVVCGTLDQLGAETVHAAIAAFTPERSDHPELTEAQLRGTALVALSDAALRGLTGTGARGGPARAVTVTVPLAVLRGGPGTGGTGWTGPLSAAASQQVACDARITRLVVGTMGEALDVGVSERYVTGPIRTALHARDGGCVWPGCHRPPEHTEAHHLVPWAQGGPTSLTNLALFCSFHHHRLHAGQGWAAGLDGDGVPWVQTPGHLDPSRPRRYHERFVVRRTGWSA